MAGAALQAFIETTRSVWGPISTDRVATTRQGLEALTQADIREDWLAALIAERPASRELHRDPEHGFMLLAHTEHEDLYRAPHDHGRAWVVYAVQSGALEIGTYARVDAGSGESRLVRRDTSLLTAGQARAYLPGDIHDTRCVTGSALLLRFTERDLRVEDQVEHRLTRFVQRGGEWRNPQR